MKVTFIFDPMVPFFFTQTLTNIYEQSAQLKVLSVDLQQCTISSWFFSASTIKVLNERLVKRGIRLQVNLQIKSNGGTDNASTFLEQTPSDICHLFRALEVDLLDYIDMNSNAKFKNIFIGIESLVITISDTPPVEIKFTKAVQV